MKKSRPILFVLVVLVLLSVGGIIGCTKNLVTAKDAATSIQVVETHVYLAPEGEPSTYALKPSVFPLETASQQVYYRLLDAKDREYLAVGSDGVMQAKKLKTDEEGNNVDIKLRVVSAVTPSVYVDVTVTIEEVAVQRIVFNPATVVVERQSDGVQLKPIFYPSHAIIGRNVSYTSDDPSIASVSSNGFVTPCGIGKVAIWVKTPIQDAFDKQISGKVTIDVRYSELNYRMDLTSDPSTLKQVVGEAEEIGIVLSQLNSICDPSPSITWYVNTTTINEVGVKDSKILSYTPRTLPAGEYRIRAVLQNSTQKLELVSDVLRMYNKLDNINADIINGADSFAVGDIVQILVSFGANRYPPESYRWTVTKPDGSKETIDKERVVQSDSTAKGDLNYSFVAPGEYEFTAEAVVKGRLSGVRSAPIIVTVGEKENINSLYNLYIDGKKTEIGYAPTLNWDALPYETKYSAEVRVGGEDGDVYTFNSSSKPEYFGADYFIIPSEVAGFGADFEVRVKDGVYGWSKWISYSKNKITPDLYGYFDILVGDYNAYVANMEELGRLLNYVTAFRPESLLQPSGDTYEFTIYTPFVYEDLPDDVYYVSDGDVPSHDMPSFVNAYKIVVAAMRTYVESTAFALGLPATTIGGANTIVIKFNTAQEPSLRTAFGPEDDEYVYTDVEFALDIDIGAEERTFAIDKLERTMQVSTSNQLYLAVAYGYKPIPVEDSTAERIYEKVRTTLASIVFDDMTATEKALRIYRWISLNVSYDYKVATVETDSLYVYDSFYLEGVFDDGLAVCDGMAKAYLLMLRIEGIPAYKVCGRTLDGGGHAWNKILLECGWVGSDATWGNNKMVADDKGYEEQLELLASEHFALTDEVLDATRITYGKHPETTKTAYSAFAWGIGSGYDLTADSDEELKYQIGTYLLSYGAKKADVWLELSLNERYVEEKGGIIGGAFDKINMIIRGCVGEGYAVSVYRTDYTLYVRLIRS